VSKRRVVVCVVAACLAAMLASACASPPPPPKVAPELAWQDDPCTQERLDKFIAKYGVKGCKTEGHPDEGILRGGLVSGGYLRFRIAYVGKIDQRHGKAFEDGVAMWNRYRDVTGFLFEAAPSEKDADFRFIAGAPPVPPDAKPVEPVEQTSCAAYAPAGSYVWYSTTNSTWANDDHSERIYAHELGHGFNLDHQHDLNVVSVMREGNKGMDCRILAAHTISDIQDADAINAFICGCGVRLNWQKKKARQP